jgi:hypothetical protein
MSRDTLFNDEPDKMGRWARKAIYRKLILLGFQNRK